MKLTFDEETILILYAEFYRKLYNGALKNEQEETSFNHSDVQSLMYLNQQLVKSHQDFHFTWNWHGPFSHGLELLLRDLDKKEKLYTAFYEKYLPHRLFNSKNKKLEEYYPRVIVERKEQAIVILDEILKEYGSNGCELLASLLYISKSVFPGFGFDVICEELNSRTDKFDIEVIKKAWRCLGILSLVKIDDICIRNISTSEIKKDNDKSQVLKLKK